MALKDYYHILGVSPAAPEEVIRKAYRKLALRYHPDRHQGSQVAALQFTEIKEAYETLIDPARREQYHQERFYHFQHLRNQPAPSRQEVTPAWILQQAYLLKETTALQNPFQLNRDALLQQLLQVLSPFHLAVLQHAGDRLLNQQVIAHCLQAATGLNMQHTVRVHELLLQLAGTEVTLQQPIRQHWKRKKIQYRVDRYKLPAAILAAILLCLLILLLFSPALS